MKRLLIALISLSFILTGCQKEKTIETFMATRDETLYALYTNEGDRLTDYSYTSYQLIDDQGYIVTNEKKQVGFINKKGKEVIPFGEYATLSSSCDMLYGTKTVKKKTTTKKKTTKKKTTKKKSTKKKSTKKKTTKKKSTKKKKTTKKKTTVTYTTSNLYVMDLTGKVLYTASKNTSILKGGIPVVYDTSDKTYTLLYKDGDVLDESDAKVQSSYVYEEGKGICVNYSKYSYFYDFSQGETDVVVIEKAGKYKTLVIDEVNDASALLYDSANKRMVYINTEDGSYTLYNMTVDDAYYDQSNNLTVKSGDDVYIIDDDGKHEMNSYYNTVETYISRSSKVYGPHKIYHESELTKSLDELQVYPGGMYIESQTFPVYVKGKGYTFYNFSGKHVIKDYYTGANPFDLSGIAIVENSEGYYLINSEGNEVTTAYYDKITSLGHSYYAVYNKEGIFGVVNSEGKEIVPVEYTTITDTPIITVNDINYLFVNKYGRSYLYDLDNDNKEVLSIEGDLVYHEEGYFVDSNHNYYTFEGDTI